MEIKWPWLLLEKPHGCWLPRSCDAALIASPAQDVAGRKPSLTGILPSPKRLWFKQFEGTFPENKRTLVKANS